MKRKYFGFMFMLVTLLVISSACSKSEQTNSANGQPAGATNGQVGASGGSPQKDIVLRFWKAGNDPLYHDYWVGMIERFENANPGIKIDFAEAPFGDAIDTKLNVAYASSDSPDIISHAIVSLSTRADKGQYEPLDRYLEQWEDRSDFPDYVWEAGEYNEKIYGMGYYPTPSLYAYRKDFFRDAGLDPEKPPTNWEELHEAALKLTQREGNMVTRAGLSLPIDDHMYLIPFGVQIGGQYEVDGLPNIYSDPFIKSLEYLTDLYKDKNVAIETTLQNENQQSLFAQGKAAMSKANPSAVLQIIQNFPELKDDIGFLDIGEERRAVWSGMEYLFMSSESKYKDEAWEFIEFAMSKEEVWERYLIANNPVVRISLQDDYVNDNPFLNQAILNGMSVGVANPKVNWAPLGIKYTKQAISEAYFGMKTPEQALKDAQDQILLEIERMN